MSQPSPPPVSEPRPRWGWPALLTVLVLLATLTTLSTFSSKRNRVDPARERAKLEKALRRSPARFDRAELLTSERRMAAVATPEADALRLALLVSAGETPPKDLRDRVARNSPALAPVFDVKHLSPAEADRLVAAIPKGEPLREVAQLRAAIRSGREPKAVASPDAKTNGVFGGLILLGAALWWMYGRSDIRPRGHPLDPVDDARLDRIPIRALSILGLYAVASGLGAGLGNRLVPALLQAALMILGTIVIFRQPVFGRSLTLRDIGISGENFGRNVLVGVACWLMTWPPLLVALTVGRTIEPYLPEAIHPVNREMATAGPAEIAGIFVLAAVIAPFWEEIFFRGLLFPGLSRLTKSGPLVGAVLSSFLFAAIHPQGIALWLGLGVLGGMSCFAAHHTKSLVPSITLHAVHNAFTLVMGLIALRQ